MVVRDERRSQVGQKRVIKDVGRQDAADQQ